MDALTRAEQFIWSNARLVERRRFAYHFRGGSASDVAAAVLAYRNADGGFGNALEPDIRCPDSQPVPTQHALELLDEVGLDEGLAREACDFLQTITTDEGGVPWLLPTAMAYPRAPWWQTQDDPPAAINPTAAICAVLYRRGVSHPWLERAGAFCWAQVGAAQELLTGSPADDAFTVDLACRFLMHAPERERAAAGLVRLGRLLLESGLVAAPDAEGYVRNALSWAPTPDHPWRPLFRPAEIDACLDRLAATQGEDGSWGFPWPPTSAAAEQEWRGWITVDNLRTLRANGRL